MTGHLSCPSHTELRLLDQLLLVFDAYVYHPYLQLSLQDARTFESNVENAVHSVYDVLMTLLATYQKWLRVMRDLKTRYMAPIMRRIQDSPWIQREIEQMESAYETAGQTLSKLEGSVVRSELQDDQIKAAAEDCREASEELWVEGACQDEDRVQKRAHCVRRSLDLFREAFLFVWPT